VAQVPQRQHEDANVIEATLEVVNAGQQVVLDRVALLRAEVQDDAARLVGDLGLVVAAGLVTAFGYVLVMLGVVQWLGALWSTPAAMAAVGGLHALLGGAALAAFRNRSRRVTETPSPRGGIDG